MSIPVPADGETPAEPVCDRCDQTADDCDCCRTCDQTADDCDCSVCDRCDERIPADSDDWCGVCERCEGCCRRRSECWTCDGCGTRRGTDDISCDNCNKCESCCNCSTCESCECRVDSGDFCGDCDRCESCCVCGGHQVRRTDGTDEFHAAARNEHKRNPSRRFVAAEIEVAVANDDSVYGVCRRWGAAIVDDGSLPDSGYEINTAPASGDRFTRQVEEICAALRRDGAEVSAACGLHIHIDARDYGWWEVRRLVLLYSRIENTLFSLVPPSRRNNHYCGRCADEYLAAVTADRHAKTAVMQAVYRTTKIKGKRDNKYDGARYRALNLHSWFLRGTVECRLAAGTTDPTKIVCWSLLWAGIIDWVATHTDRDLAQFDGRPGLDILTALAPTEEVRRWVRERHAKFSDVAV